MKIAISYDSLLYKVISRIGQFVIYAFETISSVFSTEKEAVIDPAKFPWAKTIEQNFEPILNELKHVMMQYDSIPNLSDLSEEQKRIVKGEMNWKTFILYTYGVPVEKNIRQCPETNRITKTIPGMTTAFFSILEPHTSLAPHRGPYKGVLRYHMGLIVPQPEDICGIKVDGKTYHWHVGKSLIFDDTFTHEVWNNSDERRVVLFIDFKRDYIFPFNLLNDLMVRIIGISPFVSNILKKIEQR